jgi:hypothetical protein
MRHAVKAPEELPELLASAETWSSRHPLPKNPENSPKSKQVPL